MGHGRSPVKPRPSGTSATRRSPAGRGTGRGTGRGWGLPGGRQWDLLMATDQEWPASDPGVALPRPGTGHGGPTMSYESPRCVGRDRSGRATDKTCPIVARCPGRSVSRDIRAGPWGFRARADHRRGGQRYGDLRTSGRAGAATRRGPRPGREAPRRDVDGSTAPPLCRTATPGSARPSRYAGKTDRPPCRHRASARLGPA